MNIIELYRVYRDMGEMSAALCCREVNVSNYGCGLLLTRMPSLVRYMNLSRCSISKLCDLIIADESLLDCLGDISDATRMPCFAPELLNRRSYWLRGNHRFIDHFDRLDRSLWEWHSHWKQIVEGDHYAILWLSKYSAEIVDSIFAINGKNYRLPVDFDYQALLDRSETFDDVFDELLCIHPESSDGDEGILEVRRIKRNLASRKRRRVGW